MKKIIFLINQIKMIKYFFLDEEQKIRHLKRLRQSILEHNKISKALEATGDLERGFAFSSVAWAKMSEYCAYCKKEGLDVRVTFKKP